MRTLRRLLRYFGTPCLACLLLFARGRAGAQAPVSAALQTVSPGGIPLKPALADENQRLWSEVLKNARTETGPRMKNPAISSDGLTLEVVRALREQRRYLEAHWEPSVTQAAVTAAAARDWSGHNSAKSRSHSEYSCREPVIRSVNRKVKGVVFTPAAPDNRYVIEGCFFGDAPGTVQLEARSQTRGPKAMPAIPVRLELLSPGDWSDRQINVRLDPGLGRLSDHPVTLVIYSAKHRRVELRGCRFVAVRSKPQLLSVIPSAWVKLYPSGVGSRSIRQLEYASPIQTSTVNDAAAFSAMVVRADSEPFGVGRDLYDFSQLSPGWVVESVQLETYRPCPEANTAPQSFGRWETEWTPVGVRVVFADVECTLSASPSFGFNMSLSQYAIRVWVVGPVGTQPHALAQ